MLVPLGTSLFGACAKFEGEDAPSTPDAASESGPDVTPPDAGPDQGTPRCDPKKAFGPPQPFGSLAGPVGNRDSAWIVGGGVFTTEIDLDGGTSAVRYAALMPNNQPGAVVQVSLTEQAGTLRNASWLTVDADGRTAYFVATAGEGKIGVWRATRDDATAMPSFRDAIMVIGKETVYAPTIRGNTLLYSELDGSKGYQLRMAILEQGLVVKDDEMPTLNTLSNEAAAVMSADGLRLYWGSDRPDDNASGNWDVWTASRTSAADAFGNPRRVVELNTPGLEIPTWVSDDDCTMLISTTRGRANPNTGADIYVARRPPPP